MGTLIMCTLWTLAAGFMGYSIANARTAQNIRRLRESRRWLRRRCDEYERRCDEYERRLIAIKTRSRRQHMERLIND